MTDEIPFALQLLALARQYDAGEAWGKAMSDAITHITLVANNNPGKPLKILLQRPDVREAMTVPFAQAGAETLASVRQVWLEELGDVIASDVDLNRTLRTVRRNTVLAPRRLREAILTGDREELGERLQKLATSLRRRAELSVEFARDRAKTIKLLAEAPPGATKTWHAKDHDNLCSWCNDLDGQTIGIKAEFPNKVGDKKLATYGKLTGPPRHPNCQCELTINVP